MGKHFDPQVPVDAVGELIMLHMQEYAGSACCAEVIQTVCGAINQLEAEQKGENLVANTLSVSNREP